MDDRKMKSVKWEKKRKRKKTRRKDNWIEVIFRRG